MKRALFIFALVSALLLCALAAAEGKTVTPVDPEVDPDALKSVATGARITAYNAEDNTLTLEIIVPEEYDSYDVHNLQAGDAIVVQGKEIRIQSIREDDSGFIIVNDGDFMLADDSFRMRQADDMNYYIVEYSDHTWTLLGTVTVPVPEHLIFLDEIDPSSGGTLPYPTVHSAKKFLSVFKHEEKGGPVAGPGFSASNVMVAFDETGALALIRRFYVPWE